MRVQGRIFKDGKFWLAEVPMLDAMTQGRTEEETLVMVKDMVETLAGRPGFSVTVHSCGDGDIELGSDDARSMAALMLRRQRARSGLSLAEAVQRLVVRSPSTPTHAMSAESRRQKGAQKQAAGRRRPARVTAALPPACAPETGSNRCRAGCPAPQSVKICQK